MEIFKTIVNLLYPPVCGFCNKMSDEHICANCMATIKNIQLSKIYTPNIRKKYFNKHIYMFKYNGIIRDKIISYKFNENSYIYKTFSKIILNSEKMCRILKSYDIIIAVPIHKKRLHERGYNQSELIAKEISKSINIEYLNNILIKKNNNLPQSTLNMQDRITNVKEVYNIKNTNLVNNKKIILLDDVYTTGSTVNECSKLLKHARSNEY